MNLLDKAKAEILQKVERISEIHPSGEKFFDALDEELNADSSVDIFKALITMIPEDAGIVLSGGFGKQFSALMLDGQLEKREFILFKGGIRSGGDLQILMESQDFFKKDEAIFLDDSIYGGRTFELLQYFMETYSIVRKGYLMKFTECYVIYDGCPIKKANVHSIFRYYDFFQATPNFKFEDAKS
jgi:hypothetical protein